MGKLRVLSGQQVCKILEQFGYIAVRQRGSHIVMQKRNQDLTTTVPVPNHPEIRIGTLQSIIRQTGLPRSLFEVS
ncbi:MAG: type II toxin-antitoxin system HicA family toxin [Pirellulaceae bacterium]